jgi:transposase-like protein
VILTPYLFGAVRHIALRVEEARARGSSTRPRTDSFHAEILPAGDGTYVAPLRSRLGGGDHARGGRTTRRRTARSEGPAALRRVELLRRLFQEGAKIAELAREWGVPAESLHREYAKARSEFAAALKAVVAFHVPESDAAVDRECRDLMALLE